MSKEAMRILTTMVAIATLVGCASDSGVVSLADDQYMIAKQAATGFPCTGKIKTEALEEAAQKCGQAGESVEIVSLKESGPPYVLGNYPTVELTFRCVEDQNESN